MNNKFVKYVDLLKIKDFDKETDKEEFVYIQLNNKFVFRQSQKRLKMTELEQKVPVRKTVYDKLIKAAETLQSKNPDYKLLVVFGYRELTTQKRLFNEIMLQVKNKFNDKIQMYEYIHEKIAVPEVSGHPTGGAVDVAIYDSKENKILDYGCDILDYSTNCCHYISNEITESEMENRKMLREVMIEQGFAPYDGEWWHFSYGDKEWAFYYNKEIALYNQVEANRVFQQKKNESKQKKSVKYVICRPGGNDTALVYGKKYNQKIKKNINDAIMKKHSNIEQVGFIDLTQELELQMAGGEFCGNATRSAAKCYLNGEEGNLNIIVNSSDIVNAGVYGDGKAWCEIPLYHGEDAITIKELGIYIVKMKGMTTIVVEPEQAKKYLTNKSNLKQHGMELINKFNLQENDAVGVMFCEYKNSKIKINPIVWVKSIDTLFYETACGSGTTATCMVEAYEHQSSQKIDVLQPSGLTITSEIIFEKDKIIKAIISGDVILEDKEHWINV